MPRARGTSRRRLSEADLRRRSELLDGPDLYSKTAAALELDRSERTVRRWAKADPPKIETTPDGRVPRREILRLLGLLVLVLALAVVLTSYGFAGCGAHHRAVVPFHHHHHHSRIVAEPHAFGLGRADVLYPVATGV